MGLGKEVGLVWSGEDRSVRVYSRGLNLMEPFAIMILTIVCFAVCTILVLGLIWILIRGPSLNADLFTGFDKRCPPMDDDEFLRRCRPGVNRDVALRVRRVVSKQLGIPYQQVYPEQNFVRDLGCD
jgi:hypothetical protein